MKVIPLFFALFVLVFPTTCISQSSDQEAIKKACLDYVDGAYDADGERLMQGVHSELNKAIVEYIPSIKRSFLRKSRPSQLVAVVNAKSVYLPEEERKIMVEVLDVDGDIAMAMVKSVKFTDYCQLVKDQEKWLIVNVLWTWSVDSRPQNFSMEEGSLDKEMIKKAALDYIDGAYSGNADRMERALHPELNKVFPFRMPNTEDLMLRISGYEGLIEMTRAQFMVIPEDERNIELEILDVFENMASVKVTSLRYIDYCHVALVNGECKIVNVLWRPNR